MRVAAIGFGERNVALFGVAAVCHIKFLADNRIDSVLVAENFKVQCAEHISVVSERERGHIETLRLRHKFFERGATVQKRIVRVNMKMNKTRRRRSFRRGIKNGIICHAAIVAYFGICRKTENEIQL